MYLIRIEKSTCTEPVLQLNTHTHTCDSSEQSKDSSFMITVFGTVLCLHNYDLSVKMFEAKMTLMSWILNDCGTLTGRVKM